MSDQDPQEQINWLESELMVRGRIVRIGRLGLDKYEALKEPEDTIAALRQSKRRIDLFTFMQVMQDKGRVLNYHSEMDNLAILPVSTFDNWWNNQIRSYPRNRSRQAGKRGVTIKEVPFDDSLIQGIREIYNETTVRQGKKNRHFGKDMETVRRESATYLDRSVFIGAFLENELIGFVKIVIDESRTQASLMNVAAMVQHRDKAPTNALIAECVRACADRSIPFLMYQNFEYGNKGADTLTKFKEINGFQKVDLPRYYVPLTRFGSLALSLGLHHQFIDHLPTSAAAKIRQIRNAWYNRKLQSEVEAT
jgi:hypothetical protein